MPLQQMQLTDHIAHDPDLFPLASDLLQRFGDKQVQPPIYWLKFPFLGPLCNSIPMSCRFGVCQSHWQGRKKKAPIGIAPSFVKCISAGGGDARAASFILDIRKLLHPLAGNEFQCLVSLSLHECSMDTTILPTLLSPSISPSGCRFVMLILHADQPDRPAAFFVASKAGTANVKLGPFLGHVDSICGKCVLMLGLSMQG